MKLENKTALITGASSGIGKEIAIALAKKGCNVAISYNKTKKGGIETLKECEKYSKSFLIKLDVADEHSIIQAKNEIRRHFGKIDVLVNNAGVLYGGKFGKRGLKEIQNEIEVNLTGQIKMACVFFEMLKKQKEAVIVNVASMAGKRPYKEYSVYCASKFGVRGFVQTLALELPSNMKIYSVNPGPVATRMTNFHGVSPKKVAEIVATLLEGRLKKKSGDDIDIPEYVKS